MSIANVATRYILDKSAVAGVIIGVRLGIVDHRNNNAHVFNFNLDKSDCDDIDAVCIKSNNLFETIGDCGDVCTHFINFWSTYGQPIVLLWEDLQDAFASLIFGRVKNMKRH